MAHVLWPAEKHPEPWTKTECLACHASSESIKDESQSSNLQYGVGCESCHGPARDWLTAHTSNEWQAFSQDEKARLGFRNLTQPLARAETCVRCHVGSPNQQVNHDLIAAGHPRLFFNLVGFIESPPTVGDKSYRGKWHWLSRRNPLSPTSQTRGVELAREWAVGETVSAIASLDLLEHRLKDSTKQDSHWPELAEFNCYACHHDLSAGDSPSAKSTADKSISIPQAKLDSKPRAGQLAWGVWTFATLPSIAQASGLDADKIRTDLDSLRKLTPGNQSDRQAAATVASSLKQYLQSDLLPAVEKQTIDEKWLDIARRSLMVEAKSSAADSTWDQAAEWYIAFVVLDRLQQDLSGAKSQRIAAKAPSGLLFPKGFDSPRGFSPAVLADFLKTIENTNP